MFFDTAGNPLFQAKVNKVFDWNVGVDSTLPSWLVNADASQVNTFVGIPTSSGGAFQAKTKVATPTSGDIAGVKTAFNIDFTKFIEISFIAYDCWVPDSTSATDHTLNVQCGDGATSGFYFQNNSSGYTNTRLYPNAVEPTLQWDLEMNGNYAKKKDIGFVFRPATKEFFVTMGDPYEGAGVIWYDKGKWVNPTSQPFMLRTITRVAAQKTLEFSRLKMRIVHN